MDLWYETPKELEYVRAFSGGFISIAGIVAVGVAVGVGAVGIAVGVAVGVAVGSSLTSTPTLMQTLPAFHSFTTKRMRWQTRVDGNRASTLALLSVLPS